MYIQVDQWFRTHFPLPDNQIPMIHVPYNFTSSDRHISHIFIHVDIDVFVLPFYFLIDHHITNDPSLFNP